MAARAGVEMGVLTTVISSVIDAGDDGAPCSVSAENH
jgi:hypothetical protein